MSNMSRAARERNQFRIKASAKLSARKLSANSATQRLMPMPGVSHLRHAALKPNFRPSSICHALEA